MLIRWFGALSGLVCVAGVALADVDIDRLLLLAGQRYGEIATASVLAWHDLLMVAKTESEAEKLRRVNEFFNRRIRFDDDAAIWNKPDYWATPLETMGRGRGDCEDFTIAKYVTLTLMGVPVDKLRLSYVRARIGGPQSTLVQAHMVLSYYPAPDAEPLVLDNLISEIRPASQRPDLALVFSFNADGIWVGGGAPRAGGGLSKWQSVLDRMRKEGID